ncbi:MAG: hypothetical protein QNJ07_05040 [Woeseiaceae bacterium]|nr:hypothetical protein [Woeseiaceae bacterium]
MRLRNTGLVVAVSLLTACSSDTAVDREPANRAPTVSAIPSSNAMANGTSQPIVFSVSDESVNTLAISASSDRPQLVQSDAIVVAGSGALRTLTITPTVDKTGDAMITVIARDTDGLAASSSFLLTVTAEQKSMQQFARDLFSSPGDDEPALINAVEFAQDANDDDFADLLAQ